MTDSDADIIFAALADLLIPEAEGMPRASAVADLKHGLRTVLNTRPDLRMVIDRGLRYIYETGLTDETPDSLAKLDREAWSALTLAIATVYYNSPSVRGLTGYSGPRRKPFNADATPDYVINGMLDIVIQRGPIWRDP